MREDSTQRKAATGVAYSLVVWLAVLALFYPPILAVQLWDPLDNSLYWIGLGAGFVVGWACLVVPIRGRRDGSVRLLAIVAPTWMVALTVGGNVWFDRSPAVPHASRFLGYTHPSKGPGAFRLASWRKAGTDEQIFGNTFALTVDLSVALGDGAKPGTPLVVTTHAGALGWEWIADVARAP